MASKRHLECPQCGTAFQQRQVQGVMIDYCSDCGGVWLDPGELGQLTGSHGRSHRGTSHVHGSHGHHDHEDEEEFEEGEDEGGLLGFVTEALGGGEGEEGDGRAGGGDFDGGGGEE